MDLATFISTYRGQAVSYDGIAANSGQCEQLIQLYWKECLGFDSPGIAAAVELWTNTTILENFEQIAIGDEQAGDVAVFGASSVINSPVYGHTDICVTPSGGAGYLGFDSNWGGVTASNGYPAAHEVQHTMKDVLGFLRFKEIAVEPFNSGDAQNITNALFGGGTPPDFVTAQIGQDYKTAVENLLTYNYLNVFVQANAGDQANVNNALGTNLSIVGVAWKNVVYDYVLKNLPTNNYSPVTEQLYTKNS